MVVRVMAQRERTREREEREVGERSRGQPEGAGS
jgi:hypothetical protein